jgi:uncharacterized protein
VGGRGEEPEPVPGAPGGGAEGVCLRDQNERGKFFSEGEWDILGPPKTDGYDALTWMAAQPWSNGKVGTLGCSSTAEWQMGLASLNHPAHAAMVPQGFGAGVGRIGDWYEQGNWYRGGAEQMLFFTWLYGVQNTQRPTFDPGTSREDLIRLSRYFDLIPRMPGWTGPRPSGTCRWRTSCGTWTGPRGSSPTRPRGHRRADDPADTRRSGLVPGRALPRPRALRGAQPLVHVLVRRLGGPEPGALQPRAGERVDAETRENQFAMVAPVVHCAYTRATENTVVGERSVGDARWAYDDLIYGWFDLLAQGRAERHHRHAAPGPVLHHGLQRVEHGGVVAPGGRGDDHLVPELRRERQHAPWRRRPHQGDARPRYPPGRLHLRSHGSGGTPTGATSAASAAPSTPGSFDQQAIEADRQDILVYTTEPFAEGWR